MKMLALSDIHQQANKWKILVKTVEEERPDIVCIAGDLIPKNNGILDQINFIRHMRKYAQKIKDAGSELVLIFGNDDNQLLIPDIEKGMEDGLWHYVSDRVVEVKGYEFCGCPWVTDYPFGYKYWVARETDDVLGIDPEQYGKPVVINSGNRFVDIPNLAEYLKSKPSIEASLKKTASQVKDMSRSIWLIHGPPRAFNFDLCAHGAKVGSQVVDDFILKHQPLITMHGHIHEAPEYNGHCWHGYMDKTLSMQAGQLGFDLHYVTFDLDDVVVSNLKHSIYG